MGEVGRLHPLVAEAGAQLASRQHRLGYWTDLAQKYPEGEALPEELAERIEKCRADVLHALAMHRSLKAKLEKAQAEARELAAQGL